MLVVEWKIVRHRLTGNDSIQVPFFKHGLARTVRTIETIFYGNVGFKGREVCTQKKDANGVGIYRAI